jgi:hypothetical protein
MELLIATLLLAGAGGGTSQQKTQLKGERTLHAEGNGLVYIRGRGSLTITGEGSLWYLDLAGDAQVPEKVAGDGDGWKFVSDIGSFSISGSDFIVMALGKGLVIDAEGKGKAQLAGKGIFEVHNRSDAWGRELRPVPYGPSPIKSGGKD